MEISYKKSFVSGHWLSEMSLLTQPSVMSKFPYCELDIPPLPALPMEECKYIFLISN